MEGFSSRKRGVNNHIDGGLSIHCGLSSPKVNSSYFTLSESQLLIIVSKSNLKINFRVISYYRLFTSLFLLTLFLESDTTTKRLRRPALSLYKTNITLKAIMKNIHTLLYLCIAISLINIFAILFSSRARSISEHSVPATSSEVYSTADILLPPAIELAGEAVPLQRNDVSEALRKELIVNTYLHSHTLQILRKAPKFFRTIEPILKENGIPDDFKYLAVIESRLEPLIVSPAGAVGIWQLMKGTAQDLKLEINNEIDERYHLEKATRAACDYLKKAYEKFGSWTLAAASYNAGFNMLSKQMKLQQQTDYYNLLLGEETERYVFRILALKQIMTQPELYHFSLPEPSPYEEVETIEVKESVKDWAEFAKQQGITYKTLKRFNPWLRKPQLHNPRHKTYEIAIPVNRE